MLPASAAEHYQRVQRLKVATIESTRRLWQRMEPSGRLWEEQYRENVGPALTAVMFAAQMAAAREADSYVAAVLNELDYGPPTESGVVRPRGLVGAAGDGRPVASLLGQSVVVAGAAYNAAQAAPAAAPAGGSAPVGAASAAAATAYGAAGAALAQAGQWLDLVAETLIADTTRAAEAAAIAPREWVEGYVRMLNPPSCSRCTVLAGRHYRWNAGFDRHNRCDCVHIPASEAASGDLRVNPDAYFESLPTDAQLREEYPDLTVAQRRELDLYSQEDIFTKAGAQAIREGADIGQVVNARRGMRRAQVYGRDVLVTTEGTTRRGLAYGSLNERFRRPSSEVRTRGQRYFRTTNVRLMPETIFDIAEDRADAVRLLKLHGFIN